MLMMQKKSLIFYFLLLWKGIYGLNVVGRTLRPAVLVRTDSVRLSAYYDSKKGEETVTTEEDEDIAATFTAMIDGLDDKDVNQEAILPPGGAFNGYSMPTGKKIEYSAFLDRRPAWWQKLRHRGDNNDEELDEDGYRDMAGRSLPFLQRIAQVPLRVVSKTIIRKPVEPGTLILIRHGESEWNKNKTFTGWADPDLTDQGRREVEHAARLLMAGGYKIDVVFTSRLKRAIRSVWILLQELNEVYLPVFKSWRLNERMYGALTGLSKTETAERLGQELVQEWRGSLRSRPPPLKPRDTYWPGRERRYADLTVDQIPLTESLLDCMERTTPLWENKIKFELSRGRNVLVVGHANTLRGLVKTIDNIGDAEIQGEH
eukprot:scaffold23833_cov113-Cylindrotheca_fusiformis.AAC.1